MLHVLGDKGAIGAPGGAEGNGHIQAEVVLVQGLHRGRLGVEYPAGQLSFGGRHMAMIQKAPHPCLFSQFLHILAEQLHRVDTGKHSPGRMGAGQLHKGAVQQIGHGILLKVRGGPMPLQQPALVGNYNPILICVLPLLNAGPGPGTFCRAGRKGLLPQLHLDGAVREKQAAQIFTFIAEGRTAEK